MTTNKRDLRGHVRSYLNLHIDLQTVVVVLLIVVLFNRPFVHGVFTVATFVGEKTELPSWVNAIFLGVVADFLSAFIVGLVVFWAFRIKRKSALCGKFKAYDIVEGEEVYWGDVSLTYNIFSNRIRGRLFSDKHDADICIEAVFERGEYLRGHYVEKNRLTRRRMGAFLLMLDGEGESYSGRYVFVDPCDANFLPREGRAKWVMES